MPLLRLLHQISNMYQNVKETQMELREQHPEATKHDSHPSGPVPVPKSTVFTGPVNGKRRTERCLESVLDSFCPESRKVIGNTLWVVADEMAEESGTRGSAAASATPSAATSAAPSAGAPSLHRPSAASVTFPHSRSQAKVISPTGSMRSTSGRSTSMRSASRHQSLAQKLRSTSKSVKGKHQLTSATAKSSWCAQLKMFPLQVT